MGEKLVLLIAFGFASATATSQVSLDWPVEMQPPGELPRYYISNGYGGFPHYNLAGIYFAIDFKHRDHFWNDENWQATQGRPVLAAASGRVYYAGRSYLGQTSYGNVVVIEHSFGITLYGHLAEISHGVRNGSLIAEHQQIGTMGSTGVPPDNNPHLHFEFRRYPNSVTSPPEPMGGLYGLFYAFPVRHSHSGTNNSAFVSETVPDGTVLPPNYPFEKKWHMRNTGTYSWHKAYKWEFVSGDRMQGSTGFYPVPEATPGQSRDMVVWLQTPSTP